MSDTPLSDPAEDAGADPSSAGPGVVARRTADRRRDDIDAERADDDGMASPPARSPRRAELDRPTPRNATG